MTLCKNNSYQSKIMDFTYDEVIVENVFYKTLLEDYRDLFLKGVTEGCLLCVPRAGSVSKYLLSFEDFCAHILIPNLELPESHYTNVNGEEVRISNRLITVEHGIGHQSSIHILFEETFYTDDDLKYKVLCIEKPIEGTKIISDGTNRIFVLRTLRECVDFLWLESGSSNLYEKIKHLSRDFLKSNSDIDNIKLKTIVENANSLFVKCIQSVVKHPRIKLRVNEEKNLMSNIKLAVETCMHHEIYNKLIKGISTCTASEDANLNKMLRNLSHLQIQDLDIRTELYDAIPSAKYELSKIDGYSTLLGKSGCLKKMFSALSECGVNNIVGADDVLQVLIFLTIKIGLPNWNAQLMYLKLFRFSTVPEIHDEVCFLNTSLEAAIEHIQSGRLIEVLNERSNNDYTVKGIQVTKIQNKVLGQDNALNKFFRAVAKGDIDQIKSMMNEEKNERDAVVQLCHPLCICPKCQSVTWELKENFVSVNYCDSLGLTALHIASMYCRPLIVEYLLSNGANPNQSDFNGLSPMHYAAMRGHQNGLLLLAYAGSDVNAADYALKTPLHMCSNNGHENCVKALIYFCDTAGIKLNINAQNSNGDTALHEASRWGYLSIVEILLENGADPTIRNKKKLSSLDVAHNSRILNALSRPSGKIQNYIRIIPFKPMFDNLDEESTDSSSGSMYKGSTPNSIEQQRKIEKTLKAIADGDVNLACFYLGIEGRQKPESKKRVEPLEKCHPLCRCNKCEISDSEDDLEDFCTADCLSINSCNAEGYTSLHFAAKYGRTSLCDALLKNGALVNVQTVVESLTPLMLACQHEKYHVVDALLKAGSNIDLQDSNGDTALHHAARSRNTKIVEALMKHEPDLGIRNHKNKTAFQEAKENMYISVINAMKEDNPLGLLDGFCEHSSGNESS